MKRILSILFALALVLSLGVTTAPPLAAADSGHSFQLGTAVINVPEDYETIQEAVDAAVPGNIIVVAAGEYDSFMVLEKHNIRIVSTEGATVTSANVIPINRGVVEDAWAMAAVAWSEGITIEGINFDGVAVSGQSVVAIAYVDSTGVIADLTVERVSGSVVGAGVAIIGDMETCVVNISGVTVRNSMAGVIIGVPEADGGSSTARMTGSTIINNTVGVYVFDDSSVEANFNKIVGNMLYGVRNDGGERVNAVNNWWGSVSGPFHPTANPGGTGNSVSDNVEFDPWLTADIGPVHTETVTDNGVVDATEQADTKVEVWGSGTTTVTVSMYDSNPHGGPPTDVEFLGKYIDVYVPDTSAVTQIDIRIYFTADEVDESQVDEESLLLFWWNGNEWEPFEETGVESVIAGEYIGYVWARIREDTRPSLDYLTGGEISAGIDLRPGPTDPPIGGCFIATAAYGTDTAQQLDILREFRNTILLPNNLGTSLVSFYYRTSPPIASFISQHEGLRTTVRVSLVDPIVNVLNRTYDSWSRSGG